METASEVIENTSRAVERAVPEVSRALRLERGRAWSATARRAFPPPDWDMARCCSYGQEWALAACVLMLALSLLFWRVRIGPRDLLMPWKLPVSLVAQFLGCIGTWLGWGRVEEVSVRGGEPIRIASGGARPIQAFWTWALVTHCGVLLVWLSVWSLPALRIAAGGLLFAHLCLIALFVRALRPLLWCLLGFAYFAVPWAVSETTRNAWWLRLPVMHAGSLLIFLPLLHHTDAHRQPEDLRQQGSAKRALLDIPHLTGLIVYGLAAIVHMFLALYCICISTYMGYEYRV